MQNYKIVSADLDSTLLSSDMTVSRENEEAIHALAQQGVHFVPNTGRTFGEIPEAVKQNPDIRYIIYSDGSAIYDKQSDTTKGAYLPRELYLRMLSLLKEYEALSSVRTGGVSYVDLVLNILADSRKGLINFLCDFRSHIDISFYDV